MAYRCAGPGRQIRLWKDARFGHGRKNVSDPGHDRAVHLRPRLRARRLRSRRPIPSRERTAVGRDVAGRSITRSWRRPVRDERKGKTHSGAEDERRWQHGLRRTLAQRWRKCLCDARHPAIPTLRCGHQNRQGKQQASAARREAADGDRGRRPPNNDVQPRRTAVARGIGPDPDPGLQPDYRAVAAGPAGQSRRPMAAQRGFARGSFESRRSELRGCHYDFQGCHARGRAARAGRHRQRGDRWRCYRNRVEGALQVRLESEPNHLVRTVGEGETGHRPRRARRRRDGATADENQPRKHLPGTD